MFFPPTFLSGIDQIFTAHNTIYRPYPRLAAAAWAVSERARLNTCTNRAD